MKNKNEVLLTDELMLEVANGEVGAFEKLCNKTYKIVYNYIFSIIRNHSVSEDLLHNTYINIKESINQYKPNKKPMAWIFTIARNNAYNYYNKQKQEVPIELVEETSIHSPEEKIVDRFVLKKLLEHLNEKERSVILLNVVSGYKFREISKITQIPLGTVLSCYNRGMKKLKMEVIRGE